jgi:transposase-like protein
MNSPRSPYRGYRFPPEIISYCVWLYFRLSVSYRDIEELMAERGVQPVVRKPMIRYVRVPTSATPTSAIVDRIRPKV